MPADDASPNADSRQPIPQVIIQQQKPPLLGRLGKFLLAALVVCVFIILGLTATYQSYFSPPGAPQERYHSLSRHASKKIAIISIEGTILGGEGFIKRQIDRVKEDDSIVAVVLRINSPGGTVTGSDYLYHHLKELREERKLPMVVSMGSLCASGGYYIAMAAGDTPDILFAEPTTWTGSIGVIIPHYDLSGLLGDWNIEDDSVVSRELKQMGSPTKPMTDQERQVLQGLVDESFEDFKQIVLAGRPKLKEDPATLNTVTTGQIFTAKQALGHGLIDQIGFIEAAIERAAELANYETDDVRCVEYEGPRTAMDVLLGARAETRPGLDLAALLDLTAPRAYYLYTWLPTILSNELR